MLLSSALISLAKRLKFLRPHQDEYEALDSLESYLTDFDAD